MRRVLIDHAWNVTATARALHLSRMSLYRYIRWMGVVPSEEARKMKQNVLRVPAHFLR